MNDSMKTLLAFIGGAAVGAIVGVLLAPDKGSETRKKIVSKAKDITDDVVGAASDKFDKLTNWKNKEMEESVIGFGGDNPDRKKSRS